MEPKVSVVTVNFNSEAYILKCLKSLHDQTSLPFEYIVVSNSPVEGQFEDKLKSIHEASQLIINETNLGFAKANNVGAEAGSAPYLFFLNPDAELINDAVSVLLKSIQKQDNKAIAGPATYDKRGNLIHSVKNHISALVLLQEAIPLIKPLLPKRHHGDFINNYLYDTCTRVPVINGSALMVPSQIYEELGGMYEDLFLYWEENDFCYRAERKGYKTMYCPHAQILHIGGTSTKENFYKLEVERHRSRKKVVLKHHEELNGWNRIMGIIGYGWRYLGSICLVKKHKIRQFGSILRWYIKEYQ